MVQKELPGDSSVGQADPWRRGQLSQGLRDAKELTMARRWEECWAERTACAKAQGYKGAHANARPWECSENSG